MSALRFFVHRNPHPTQLSTRRWVAADAPTPPAPWVETTEADHAAWEAAQIAAGWVPVPEAPPSAVPESASRQSILIELYLAAGIQPAHLAAFIAGIPDEPARVVAQLEFERQTWRRGHPMIAQIGGALTPPMTSDGADEIFRRAAARDAAPL